MTAPIHGAIRQPSVAQGDRAFMLKGVSRIDDAKRAVDSGVSAISVSNHGGNNLDGPPATIRVLPAAGVENVLDVLRNGLDSALFGLGKSSVHDLTREDVIIPPGFLRSLGGQPKRIIAGASAIVLPAGR